MEVQWIRVPKDQLGVKNDIIFIILFHIKNIIGSLIYSSHQIHHS